MNLKALSNLTYFRGRVALYAILKALGVSAGDQVVTQAFTCVAVPEAIMASGARPVYVDIEPNGFNMDAGSLERKITPQTRAIIVQHTYGIPARIKEIKQIAENASIPIIEDCCHTLSSIYKGETVGGFGVASFYSFEWGKPVVAGIGGSVLINDKKLNEKIKSQYVNYFSPPFIKTQRIQLQYFGFKVLYRPSFYWKVRDLFHKLGRIGLAESNYNPIQVANIAEDFFLRMPKPLQKRMVRNLNHLDVLSHHSRWVSDHYQSRIESKLVEKPLSPMDYETVYARYPLITHDKPALLKEARKANIELADWYSTPIHPLCQKDWPLVHYVAGSCPVAEKRCRQVVTLPTHMLVREKNIKHTVTFLNEAVF